jgi:hypothetical protein
MTRWTPLTRLTHYPSQLPYNYSDTTIYGFIGTHQPAIWMGESGSVRVGMGEGDVSGWVEGDGGQGWEVKKEEEVGGASYYRVVGERGHGRDLCRRWYHRAYEA